MKSFLKYTLATIVGIVVVNVALFFILIGFAGAMIGLSQQTYDVKDNTILHLSFSESIPDRASANPLGNFNPLTMSTSKPTGLNQILAQIKQAKTDSRICGIYLDINDILSNFGGLATIDEIRAALLDFKESGKFIYSYSLMGYSQKSYYLACVADSVFVNPESTLQLAGLSATVSFYKETLEKLGVRPEIFRVGKFKSAVEPFTSMEMSDANREQMQRYLSSQWGNMVAGISDARGISAQRINELVDNFKIYTTKEFVQEGFFDGAIYKHEMIEKLKRACGLTADEDLRMASLSEYAQGNVPEVSTATDKVAVIFAEGNIGVQQGGGGIGPDLAETIRQAREDKDVKAIVLRVNSGGGSALTSDIIWKEVQLAAREKVLIASMGNVAASGGYYISCAADTIMAEPTTLTGSIGIFGLTMSGEELIKDKIGLATSTVKTNEHSDFGGGYPLPIPVSDRPMTEYEKGVMQAHIEQGYDTFLSRVSEGRGMSKEDVHEIAQGRVWTGEDAMKIGLVDVFGGLEDAVRLAAEKAGLENYRIAELPAQKNPFELILNNLSASVKENVLRTELGGWYEWYQNHKALLTTQGVMARIPYDIVFN